MDLCDDCGTPVWAGGEALGLLLFLIGGVVLAGLGLLLSSTGRVPPDRAGLKRAVHLALVLQYSCLAAASLTLIVGLLAVFLPPAAELPEVLLVPVPALIGVNAAGVVGWRRLQERLG